MHSLDYIQVECNVVRIHGVHLRKLHKCIARDLSSLSEFCKRGWKVIIENAQRKLLFKISGSGEGLGLTNYALLKLDLNYSDSHNNVKSKDFKGLRHKEFYVYV